MLVLAVTSAAVPEDLRLETKQLAFIWIGGFCRRRHLMPAEVSLSRAICFGPNLRADL